MTFALFDAPLQEPSQFVGFGGNRIDRQAEHRSDDATTRALADPSARLMLMRGGRCYLKLDGAAFDPYFDLAGAEAMRADLAGAVLLGVDADGPIIAAPGGLEPDALPDGVKAIDYRSINVQGLIDPAALGALAQGASLLAWHASHAFCSRCGTRSEMRIGGYKRQCPNCNAEHFPRTDPVAIMLAVTRDRCLLGRSPHFAPGMFSALAGFIEPGETIENAVRRETFEESGIRLGRVAYHASQPWPFPYSLMIGCYGEALNEDINADMTELEACRWFSRDEVWAALEGRHPDGIIVPPRAAIASQLIRNWAESD
ncbi:NAD(+) diphosphatase [Arvimicrobium flavum]|uniref:NAD(+) diphosphatase n=1 Tax=Arvimicrobium flavum TaxID=3393320 RepID=UPI00237B0EBE|nr:NAD(+) diphosphatase [Mesorhizobium shangrilense]